MDNTAPTFERYPLEKVEKFKEWLATQHGADVYAKFVEMAKETKAAGWDHYGARTIAETIRHHFNVRGPYKHGFKILNDFIPMMARQLIIDHPEFDGFFTLHKAGRDA